MRSLIGCVSFADEAGITANGVIKEFQRRRWRLDLCGPGVCLFCLVMNMYAGDVYEKFGVFSGIKRFRNFAMRWRED